MKTTYCCVVFLVLTIIVRAQERPVSFSRIDWAVQSIDAETPESLAFQLTAPYKTDLEKVRSIFRWITEHIAYTTRPRVYINDRSLRYKQPPLDSMLALKSVDEIVAYSVLQKRTAVCNGYARLFKTLCGYAGIPAEIITGYARVGNSSSKFRSNHSWNAVYVDSTWRLVDATWASGFISYTDEFVKQYDESFFFPEPEQFIRSHYPEDMRWALLQDPPTLSEFYHTPFKLTAFMKYGISTYTPARGVIEAAVGDTLQFRFELKEAKELKMAPELTA
ncbi:MAG TPA: transglutaminase domain-containing protein, partial [Niastella sp.]|nr:transglutaminase domain-containing protein [Niastella sp.]